LNKLSSGYHQSRLLRRAEIKDSEFAGASREVSQQQPAEACWVSDRAGMEMCLTKATLE
jgi:hypothetical protein